MSEREAMLNEVLLEQLREHGRVFLGEYHDDPALRQTLEYLMPQLKAEGVTDLSLELGQNVVDSITQAESYEEWSKLGLIADQDKPEDFFHLVKAAQDSGINVIGHEDETLSHEQYVESTQRVADYLQKENPEFSKKLAAFRENYEFAEEDLSEGVIDGQQVMMLSEEGNKKYELAEQAIFDEEFKSNPAFKEQYEKYVGNNFVPLTQEGLRARNDAAANIINQARDPNGKLAVLGGALHTNKVFDEQKNLQQDQKNDGLDTRLDMPAITVDRRGGLLTDPPMEHIGKTTEVEKNHFETMLPDDLKKTLRENAVTSWAAKPKHVEHHEEKENPLPQGSPKDAMPLENPFRGK